jgi:murein DD-endopeptidase MepM/ murein hydrolase activator NlpD
MINPTGGRVRIDNAGSGYFRASRGTRYHQGVDFECDPAQEVLCPISGKIVRIANPYSGDPNYSGVLVENPRVTIKLFYVKVAQGMIGKEVKAGEVIGEAQDVTLKYKGQGMLPHVHLEIVEIDPLLFMEMP